MAKLDELGFKNVRVVKVLGSTDRVVKVSANGKPVRKIQKVPVSASIVLEVSDGRLGAVKDSLQNEELMRYYQENPEIYQTDESTGVEDPGNTLLKSRRKRSKPIHLILSDGRGRKFILHR